MFYGDIKVTDTAESQLVEAQKSNYNTNFQNVHSALLDIRKVPPTVGEKQRARANEILQLIENTDIPIYLIGPSGSGKSQTGKRVAAVYGYRHKVPVYYVQLSQEDTKSSIIIGHRMVNGTLTVVEGVIAEAARKSGIVFLDEITHSTEQMLLTLNSLDGHESVITIGDKRVDVKGLKVIYGSNDSSHSGNIKVPPSFANRVIPYKFNYPEWDEELSIGIELAKRNIKGNAINTPKCVLAFFTSFIREIRKDSYPLSIRNIAHAAILFHFATVINQNANVRRGITDDHFKDLQNNEPRVLKIASRILNQSFTQIKDVNSLLVPEVLDFIDFVSRIGVEQFKEKTLQAINYYVDMEGLDIFDIATRQQIITNII
jgi:hypothetical protein